MHHFPSWIHRKTFSWALYDFADTAFSTLFITFFFPLLIVVHLGGNEFHVGLSMGLSVALAAVLVPIVGAISDLTGRRLPILLFAAAATAALTVFAGYAGLIAALVIGFMTRITNLISKDVYDAKMTDLVPEKLYGSLSGLGVGVGYIGMIASLIIGAMLLQKFGWETIEGVRAVFWQAAVFYILFSIPLFIYLKDTPKKTGLGPLGVIHAGMTQVWNTVKNFRKFPIFTRFLGASFLYNNAMNTVVIFLGLYGRNELGLTIKELFPILGIIGVSAAIGSFMVGRRSDRLGPVGLIRLMLVIWITVVGVLMVVPSYLTFLVMGSIGGVAIGALWTLNRHMVSILAPKNMMAELFGFEGLTEKFSGLVGPIVFGFLAAYVGYTSALFSIIIFFLAGLWTMRKVKLPHASPASSKKRTT